MFRQIANRVGPSGQPRRFAVGLLAAAIGIAVTGFAIAAPAPAGTTISNTASATYFNDSLGVFETVKSNTVSATVLPVPAFDVVGEQTLRMARSSENQYNFRAENTGNVPLDIVYGISELPGDDFDVAGILYIDTNSNGVIDSGELPLASGAALPLRPGEAASLIYRFRTPASVVADDVSISRLNARATPTSGSQTPIVIDRESRTIIDASSLLLLKSASLRASDREIDYTIVARNNAESPIRVYDSIDGEGLFVDGSPRSAVVVRDPIPLNTTIKSARPAGGFMAVFHLRGDPEHTYRSTLPQNLSDVDALAFLSDGDYDIGRSSDLTFTVSISPTVADTNILNVATGYLGDGRATTTKDSNEVVTQVTGPGHTIGFRDGTGDDPITSTAFDKNVLVQIGAAACNATREIDIVEVTITTRASDDKEVLIARETGANTGIFRTAPIGVIRNRLATQLNNVLEGVAGDAAGAQASAVCLGESLVTTLEIQPGGFVFDSVTNAPVPGSRVVVFTRAAASIPENSLFADAGPSGTAIANSLTDAEGYFDLGPIPRGDYHLEVFPPDEYIYPSVRSSFDGFGRRVDDEISYGLDFTFDGGPIKNIDIPLDPSVSIPTTLEKTADRRKARRGGVVVYTLTAKNRMAQALLAAQIEDQLPKGLLYLEGSARLDGEPLATDPNLTSAGVLTFDINRVAPNTTVILTYAVRVGTASGQGKKVNTAVLSGQQAGTTTRIVSQQARATIAIDDRGGVFSDEAVVIGRVFLDRDGNGIQTAEDEDGNPHSEPGVPGVKIVTSTGLSVVTDSEGRYSLFGLRPVTHTFALQSKTLPVDGKPMAVEIDDLGAPGSRLIDLKRGELRAEDFPIAWTDSAAADVKARKERFDGLETDESLLRDDLPLSFNAVDRNSTRTESGKDTKTQLLTTPKSADKPVAEAEPAKRPKIEEAVKDLDPTLGFVDLVDGAETGRPSIILRVKSPAEAVIALEVNGERIPESQIGAKAVHRAAAVQMFEYVAVRLKPNANRIAVVASDPFGNERGREEITIYAPGAPAAIEIVAPKQAPANASARIPIKIRIVDAEGRLVRVPAEVTLTAQNGEWDTRDIRDQIAGLQAYIDNGEATFDFIPPDLVGGERLGVRADFAEAHAEVGFIPDLSERTFVGVIEGAVSFGENGSRIEGLMEKDDISAFEETTEGVRGQIYLKGKILGENLLTLRYDSDQDTNERLFRDIRRDEFYPVYGDRSERGFDAQSSTSLYVKVEREQSYLLYGDIAIEPQSDAIRLGAYRRSLTGGRAHIEHGPVTVDLFVAETDAQQRVIELRGRGVSGPYDIDLGGIEDGSETVEIIVRDRDQPSVILSTQSQVRYTDYSLDFFRGSLIFNRPVPQLDANLNPVSIRVTFETEDGVKDKYFVYGGEIRVEPVDGFAVGYREVRSDAPSDLDDRRTVRAGYAEADFEDYGKIELELAQTENNRGDSGTGMRASYEFRDDKTTVRAEAARTDEDFDAPNSYVGPGREEVRIRAERTVTERITVGGEALYTRDSETGDRRAGLELRGRYSVNETLDLIAGARAVDTERSGGNSDVLSGIAGVEWRPRQLPGAALRAEYEQDFNDSGNWRVLLGGDYQWSPTLRFYALNEISSTETGFFGLGDGAETNFVTKVGAEYQLTDQLSGFSEYRDSGGLASEGGVANGMRGTWDVSDRFAIRASFEHVEPIGDDDDRSTSATLGMSFEDGERGLILRNDFEVDRDERGFGLFTNTAVGYELNRDLTVLVRNRLAYDFRDDDRLRDRLRFGLAWRPEHDSRLKALALYEFEIDDDVALRELAHRWSLGGTYGPTDDLRMNARYSGEHVDFEGAGFAYSSTLHLVRAGAEFDFAKDRFSVGGHVALFTDDEGDDVTAGVGVEVKANVAKNVQIGIGYNHIDVDEDRLRDIYRSGFYARLRLKLDDSVWDEFDNIGITAPQ